MQSSNLGKMLAMLALLVLIIGAVVRFSTSKPPSSEQSQAVELPRHETVQRQDTYIPPVRASGHVEPVMEIDDAPAETNSLAVSREKIEAYLKLHNRNAASLLAAFHAADNDTNYLKEAAMNFPNDPHVQLAVLEHDLFPEDRRKWLDAFKASSPDNSLANYLSAEDYLKNNQPDAAIKELTDAYGKEQFVDFHLENYQNAKDLYQSSGQTLLEADSGAMSDMSRDFLPLLAEMKQMAIGMGDLQKQYVNSGDNASVENLAELGLGLAERFSSGDDSRFIISQLVGMAIESITLQQLNQNTAYDFLGGNTPAQQLAQMKQERSQLGEMAHAVDAIYPGMTEAERADYAERKMIYGESAAQLWLQQQHPTITPGAQ